MDQARIIGVVVATDKVPTMHGVRLLVAQPEDRFGEAQGEREGGVVNGEPCVLVVGDADTDIGAAFHHGRSQSHVVGSRAASTTTATTTAPIVVSVAAVVVAAAASAAPAVVGAAASARSARFACRSRTASRSSSGVCAYSTGAGLP